jgi:HEAT repeat protein
MRQRMRWCFGAVIFIGLGFGAVAEATPPGKSNAAPVAPPLSAASVAKLKSPDLNVVKDGLDDARLAGRNAASAVPAIAKLLASGLPYPTAEAALDTLGDIESPEASLAIASYAHHRNASIRLAAVRALAKTGGAIASPTLRGSLADPDAHVRAAAATSLGALKAKGAVADLFLALDHHFYEAAVSIGQLCEASECDAFLGRLGKVPFDVMITGIDPILFRPSTDVSDEAKVAIVDKVRDVGTREANHFLKDIGARWPKKASPKVRSEIDAAVLATMASPGGG